MFPSLYQIWLILKNGFYLFPSLSKRWLFNYGFRFHLCPKVGLISLFLNTCCCYLCPKVGLISLFLSTCCCYLCPKVGLIFQISGLFLVDLKDSKILGLKRQRFGQTWHWRYAEREIGLKFFCKETKVAT